jgi:glycerophosphoryl diester phosphodiesterase
MALIYAHRGASAYAPENTLEAFRMAMEMGADGVELDVHLSKDGELMVIHDDTVDRTTDGHGHVRDMTLEELKALDARNGMDAYPGVRIPTLREVYALLQPTGAVVNIEVKTTESFYPGIEEKLLELEREMGMVGRTVYSSFNHYTIANLRKLDPEAKLGLLYMSGLYEPWNYAKLVGAEYIHPIYFNLMIPGLARGCHENGIGINAWTVDDPQMIGLCLQSGANVITNKPDLAVELRKGQ